MNVAIIPARCGSKSILNKNLQKLGTKSLVDRAILSAIEARIFSKIVLTTDIPSLIEEYKEDPRVFVRERPPGLCQDETLMQDTVKDVVETCDIRDSDILYLLQPTSPFRKPQDFTEIAKLFMDGETQSVISVVDCGAHHPNRMYWIKYNELYPLKKFTDFKNKQDLETVYLRSGHYYVFRARAFKEQNTFLLKPCRPYVIERERRMNIDEPLDLVVAKFLVSEGLCR